MSQTFVKRLVLVCTVAWASPAAADPVTIVSNGSGIAGLAYAAEGGIEDLARFPDTPNGNNSFNLFAQAGGSSAIGSSSITSDLTDLSHLRASGATSASYATSIGQGEGHVSSHFFVFFELDRPHGFAFDADFVTNGDVINTAEQHHRASWHVTLLAMGPGGTSSEVIAAVGNTSTTVVRDGLLPAGLYRFLVSGTSFAANLIPQPASGNVFSNFSFSLALNDPENQQPVPEPASLLLLATGLGGVMMARRRQQRGNGQTVQPDESSNDALGGRAPRR